MILVIICGNSVNLEMKKKLVKCIEKLVKYTGMKRGLWEREIGVGFTHFDYEHEGKM